MRHTADRKFWIAYRKLPVEIRRTADANFELLKANPDHPSLRFKKVGDYWSARVTRNYRAVAIQRETSFVWIWIGLHDPYERKITL